MQNIIIQLICPDQKGIIAQITSIILQTNNNILSIEQHVNWITDCIEWMMKNDKTVIESTKTAEDDWMVLVNEIADMTVFTDTKSWYNGSNIDSKAKAFLPFIGVPVYTELLDEVVSENYKGFIFDKVN